MYFTSNSLIVYALFVMLEEDVMFFHTFADMTFFNDRASVLGKFFGPGLFDVGLFDDLGLRFGLILLLLSLFVDVLL